MQKICQKTVVAIGHRNCPLGTIPNVSALGLYWQSCLSTATSEKIDGSQLELNPWTEGSVAMAVKEPSPNDSIKITIGTRRARWFYLAFNRRRCDMQVRLHWGKVVMLLSGLGKFWK